MIDIDAIRINFNQDQLFILNICLAFLMFGVALDVKIKDFRHLFAKPKAPIVGLTSQLILLPLLTLVLVFIFKPPTSIALGMVLVSVCPGGNVSNFATHLANANRALSVLMTSISTLVAAVITPIWFGTLKNFVPGTENFSKVLTVPFGEMVLTIIQLIIVPLVVGMLLAHKFPKFIDRIKGPVKGLSIVIFLGFVVVAVYGNFDNLVNYLHIVFLLVLIHNASALMMGYWFAKANRLGLRERRTISMETGIQNSGLGLILIFNFFDGLGGMALIAAWWGVWHLVAGFTMAMIWSKRQDPGLSEA